MKTTFILLLTILCSSMFAEQPALFGLHIGDSKKQVVATLSGYDIKITRRGTPEKTVSDTILGESKGFSGGYFLKPLYLDGKRVKLIRLYYDQKKLASIEVEIDGDYVSPVTISNLHTELKKTYSSAEEYSTTADGVYYYVLNEIVLPADNRYVWSSGNRFIYWSTVDWDNLEKYPKKGLIIVSKVGFSKYQR